MYGRRTALVRPGLMGVLLVAAFAWACGDGLQDALLEPESQPLFNSTTGSGVAPVLVAGNPSCTTLNADDVNFPSITSNFGFKIEGVSDWNGTYQLTSSDGVLTGGALEDPGNSITISNSDGTSFDWTATLSLDAVIVKGGTDGNAYVYDPESFSDTDLHSPINPSTGAPYAISHIEFCYDYELTAAKTADASYTRTYNWEIAKDVAPSSLTGFIGQSFAADYTVAVDQTVVDSDWAVTGDIHVSNPTPFAVTFSVTDDVGGTAATVSCPAASLAAGASMTCTYQASLAAATDGVNTATITVSSPAGVQGTTAAQPYQFGEPTVVGYDAIHVTDTNGLAWEAFADVTWTYSRVFDCPTDLSLYAGGVYSYTVDNTAEITETGQSDTEIVPVTCYALTVTKDANTEWFRKYDWDITKSVTPASHSGFPGDPFTSSYTVDVDQTITEYGYRAYGTISITTPSDAPGDITVDVADAVDGATATVDCGSGATSVTVSPGVTGTCDYTVDLSGNADVTNTAIITYNGVAFAATAPVTFGEPTIVGYPTINVTDYFDGDTGGQALGSASDDKTFTYSRDFPCSTDEAMYTSGVYTDAFPNYAEIDETADQDDANVDLTCYLPADAEVIKTTTEGSEDIGQFPFSFTLYDPSGAAVETQTLGAAGTVAFAAELKTEGVWTIVETLPEGWVAQGDTECTFEIAFPGSAGATYQCSFYNVEESRADLLKLTNGVATTVQAWTFELYEGPDGFGGTLVASDATPPAGLDFGNVDLDPFATYTLCEKEVPAGYSTFWQVDTGTGYATVVPYNPNADDDPPEDLGNRCVDFGAGTNLPLTSGETIHFMVDNQAPGGDPRTPGYWKNWNRCTGGNQQYTAAANGGYDEGFWVLEDVLDPTIGGGVTWDDILADGIVFPISDCAVAVDILDKREVGSPTVVGDGKKAASDPLFNLATHLLAAQLNFGAGACTTQSVLDAALQAETLLDKYDFDGDGHDQLQRRDPDNDLANQLATYLDNYNNGMYCGSTNGN